MPNVRPRLTVGLARVGRAVLLTGMLAGCGEEKSDEAFSLPRWNLKEGLRIGSVDGEDALTEVRSVAIVDSAIFVLDASPARVFRFSLAGEFIASFGRLGGGPGEFVSPSQIGVVGDTLWVADPRGQRLELFDLDGVHQTSVRFRIERDSLGTLAYPRALLRDGSVLASPFGVPITLVLSGAVDHENTYLSEPDGSVIDTIYRADIPKTDFFRASHPGSGMSHVEGQHPHPLRPLQAALSDGSGLVVVERDAGDGSFYTVRFWSVEDGRIQDYRVPYEPIPTPTNWIELSMDGVGIPKELERPIAEALSPRPIYPPVSALVTGMGGKALVRRETIEGDSVRWDVIDREQGPVAWMVLSTGLEPISLAEGSIWAIERDDLDVPFLVQLLVREAGG